MKKLYPGLRNSYLVTNSIQTFIIFLFFVLATPNTGYSQMCAAPPLGPGTHVSVDPPTFQWYVSIAGICGPVVLGATTQCPINSNTPPPYFGSFPLTDTCYLMSNSQWNSVFSLNANYCWGSHVIGGGYIWQSGGYPITRLAAVLPPVSLLFPTNADTQISISPRIFWIRIDSANSYTLRVYSDACCLTTVFDSTSSDIAISVPLGRLSGNSRYYYRVKSYKAGGEGPFSDPFYFNTWSGQIPNLLSPHFNSEGVQLTPTLDWEDIQNPLEHRVQVSTDLNFNSVIADVSGLSVSQYNIPAGLLTYNSVYYWRTTSRTSAGWTPFSEAWNFRTFSIPDPVLLSYPANNSVEIPTALTFRWHKASETLLSTGTLDAKKNKTNAIDAIDKYWFELTTDPVTMADLITDINVLDTTKFISGLSLAREYYWRVRANNELGWGEFSSWWKFTTVVGPPQAPVLISPQNNSIQQFSNLPFIWNRSSEITAKPTNGYGNSLFDNKTIQKSGDAISAYWFEFVEDTVSMTGLLRDTILTDTVKILNLPANSRAYFWRVKAKNAMGWGTFSSWWKFFTVPAAYAWEVAAINVGSGISAISFPNTSIGYLVSDNSGTAITYKTTDGGSTWSYVSGTFMMFPHSMVFTNPTDGYIASGPHSGMNYPTWSTGDGGVYWGPMAYINYQGSNIRSVAATVEGLVYVGSLTTFGTVQYTYSAILGIGVDPLLYHTIPLNRVRGGKNNAWTVGAQGIVYRSMARLDVGENVNLTGISFNDDNTGYAVGENKFFKSTNNGSSWFRLYPLTDLTSYNDVYFANKDTGWVACTLAGEGVVIGTSNGGVNWEVQYKGPHAGSEFTFIDNKYGWLLCGNSVLRTTNVAGQQNPPPVLLQPADGATAQSLTPQLDWQDAQNSVSYRIQLSADSLFSGLLIDDTTITASNYDVQPGILQGYTRYFWRVASKNTSSWSDFSQIFRFRTIGAPNPVTLNYPANNAAGIPTIFSFNWFAASSSKMSENIAGRKSENLTLFSKSLKQLPGNYWFEITRDTNDLLQLMKDSLLTDTVKTISGLTFSTGYYWRVKAHNDLGWGEFSPWWKFTTSNGAPVLLEPVYNQTEVPVIPLLNWSDVPGAVKYRVQVSAYSTFSVLWINDSTSVTSQYQVLPGILAYNSAYYWRVKTKNDSGWGDYQSPLRFFTQITPPPAAPVLNAPANGITGISLTPLLDWNDISGSTKFRLQVTSVADFSSRLIDDSSITTSEFTIPAGILAVGSRYYWRTAVKGSSSWSSFSAVWSFTTIGIPPQVLLVSPLNNATGQPLNINFSWTNAPEVISNVFLKKSSSEKNTFKERASDRLGMRDDPADKYWFELTTDTNTPAAFYLDSTLADTNKGVNGLTALTSYYWRVKAGNASGWGNFTSWWKFSTFSGAPPAPPALLAPAYMSYDIPVTPLLDWTDVPEVTKYRVQVSAYSSFAVLWIDDSSSSVSQFQVSPGFLAYNSGYYWRVKAKNDLGWGNFQSPFRFFTLVNPPPQAPVLVSPTNGATGVSLTPVLDWNDISLVTKYRVQVSTSPSFTGLIIDDSSLAVSGYTVAPAILNTNTQYYWRVAARNSLSWGNYSQVWSFTTSGIPLQVTLLNPANNSIEQPLNITFVWSKGFESLTNSKTAIRNVGGYKNFMTGSSGTDAILGYWFELTADTVSQSGILRDSSLTDTTRQVNTLSTLTNYYWRVKAKNEIGWGEFSSWWKFTTTSGLPPAPPALITPAYGAAEIPVTPLLDWSDSPGAAKYRLQVSAYSSFAVLWIDDSSSSVSQFQVNQGILAYNSGYYWRVKAKNDMGWGNYQAPYRFFTLINPPPQAPVLVNPANGATGIALTPTLDWNDVSGITKYRVQVSISPAFTGLIFDDSSVAVSSYTVASGILNPNTLYYWRIAAKNTLSWGNFSQGWSFRTISVPSPVVLSSPVNNAVEQPLNLTFTWRGATELAVTFANTKNLFEGVSRQVSISGNTGTDAIQNYWFEICSDTVSLAGIIKDSLLTDTTKQLSGLSGASVYYWRVKAQNEIGWGGFSAWWKFTTLSGLPPAPPILISPAYGAAEIPVTPVFDWNDSPGAMKYRIQVSAYGNFSVLWIDDSSSAISQFQVSPGILAYNSGYYWRIKAKNAAGWGSYQSAYRFFTQIIPPPQPPVLISPVNGATGVPLVAVFDWSDAASAVKYRIQISSNSGFTTLVSDDSGLVTSAYTIPAGVLSNNTNYYWRVSVKTSSSWSTFSSSWSFTTVAAVAPPVLRHPVLRDTGIAVTTLFDWSNTPGAVKYRLQVSAYSSFAVLWIDKYVNDTAYLTPPGILAYNSRYFWRVKTLGSSDSSGYSATYNFFTKIVPGGDLTSVPAKNFTLDLPVQETGDKRYNYSLEVCKDTLFEELVLVQKNITSGSVELPAAMLDEYSTYFWRVYEEGGKSSSTVVRVFVTYALDRPVLNRNELSIIPDKYALYQNYPNPFNPASKIKFDIPGGSSNGSVKTNLAIYDVLGRQVETIIDMDLIPGSYEVTWNAAEYPSGIYFYRLSTEQFTDTKKMILLR